MYDQRKNKRGFLMRLEHPYKKLGTIKRNHNSTFSQLCAKIQIKINFVELWDSCQHLEAWEDYKT